MLSMRRVGMYVGGWIDIAVGGLRLHQLLLLTQDKAQGGVRLCEIRLQSDGLAKRGHGLVQLPLFQQDEAWATVTGRYNWPVIKKLNMPIAWATPREGLTGGLNVLVLVASKR